MQKLAAFIVLFFSPLGLIANNIKDFLPPHAVIFDVGANIGDKTFYYLSLGASTVLCIEPHPEVVLSLQNRYKGDPRIIIEPLGLSHEPGTLPFFPAKSNTISTMASDWKMGRFKNECWEPEIQVLVTTLDLMIEKYGTPDFCKIDVEGYEWNVLMGLTKHIPYLSFEFAYEFLSAKTKPCIDRLTSIGFTHFNVAFGENPEFIFATWVDAETLFSFLQNLQDTLSWGDIYAR